MWVGRIGLGIGGLGIVIGVGWKDRSGDWGLGIGKCWGSVWGDCEEALAWG